jgi:hypothetical protein
MVALGTAAGDQDGRAASQRVGDEVLELAHLVAAPEVGQVVALDPEVVRPEAERGSQPRCRLDRGGPVRELYRGNGHGSILPRSGP